MLQRVRILEPSNPNRSTGLINGKTSGILNWNDVAYPRFYDFYQMLNGNFWQSKIVNMKKDKKQFLSLPKNEQEAFHKIIALLATLDAPQTRIAINIAEYVSDSSVHAITAVIAQQEAVHNESYSYVLASIAELRDQNKAFEIARTDEVINKRNEKIMKAYDNFLKNKTPKNLVKVLVYSLILEGIYFYSGFAFFYNLARQQKMVDTSTMISYINRDEIVHGRFMADLLRAILAENPELNTPEFTDFIITEFKEAVELEREWSEYVLGDIDGIDLVEMHGYVKYRANKMIGMLGIDDLYPGYDENIMPWIKAFSDNFNGTNTDQFEQKPRTYATVSSLNGFSDL